MALRSPRRSKSSLPAAGSAAGGSDGTGSERRSAERRQADRREGISNRPAHQVAVPIQSLAVQLASQLPERVLQRLPNGTQVRDLIYALETQIRLISFDPSLPVTVVSSADGGHVFALQGALSDPDALRASVCIEQLRPMAPPR